MNTLPKKHTNELTEQPRKVERATCPECGGKIAVKRIAGARLLEYHHNPARGYDSWCVGSDMNLDEDSTA